jgi:DNA replication protein DnaC
MNEGSGHQSEFYLAARKQWVSSFLPEPFRAMGLSEYPPCTAQHAAALEAVRLYVDRTRTGIRSPLFIFGTQGSGKTMLASCVWNELAYRVPDRAGQEDAQHAGTADNIVFVTGAQLVTWFRSSGQEEDDRRRSEQRRYHISTATLAVIDDLDKFPNGEWGNALLQVIDERVWQHRLITLITSNLAPPALALRYGEAGRAIVSRLQRAGTMFVRLDERLFMPVPQAMSPVPQLEEKETAQG